MSSRSSVREISMGVVILASIVGLIGLFAAAEGGPAFLASQRTFHVDFRDGQGIRVGSPVRIAGLDAGQVVGIDLAEVEGSLRARVTVSVPTNLAKKLRKDVKITIQASLAGQSRVNIVSAGKSTEALAAGQVITGFESTFFDPILEQVGMGPVERGHLSHTIAEVRETVDAVGPRVRLILAMLQETAAGLRNSSDSIRPAVEETAAHVQELSRKIAASAPKIENTLTRLESLTGNADVLVSENRPAIRASLASARDLTATLQDIATKDRVKVEKLLDGLDGTRARTDRVLYQADLIASQGVQTLTKSRADIERTVANVRDATDWGSKLVQKIYANPFFLSPFYKPTPEDVRTQTAYDTAQVFTKGAQELNDLIKTLDAMQARATTVEQKKELALVQKNILALTDQLGQTSQLLANALKPAPRNVRIQR